MMRMRVVLLVATTLAGICAGILGDKWEQRGVFKLSESLNGVVLSPVAITVGGRAVTITGLDPRPAERVRNLFLAGGLLFWPIYIALAVLWLWRGYRLLPIVIVLWTAQGFFQIGLRWMMISSV